MTTITEPPTLALESAIKAVDEAREQIQDLTEEVETAQQRASETKTFIAAAELEYQNAEARYLVLKELLEKQDRLEDQLEAARSELEEAKEVEKSVTNCRTALKKVTGAAERFVAKVRTVADEIDAVANKLDEQEREAPPGHKAGLHNAARSVHGLHNRLAADHETLRNELHTAQNDYDAVPEITGVAELQRRVDRLEEDLRSAKAERKGKLPAVSASDLKKAKADRDNAELARRQAPEADRAAQADLRAKQGELTEAQTGYAEAVAAFEQVEGEFINHIEVSEPDTTGWATARAVLQPGMEIPEGYVLRWRAGGAPMKPDNGIGQMVRIDANALPLGNTAVEATIDRLKRTNQEERDTDD
jgi:chromosome segregation ATPase